MTSDSAAARLLRGANVWIYELSSCKLSQLPPTPSPMLDYVLFCLYFSTQRTFELALLEAIPGLAEPKFLELTMGDFVARKREADALGQHPCLDALSHLAWTWIEIFSHHNIKSGSPSKRFSLFRFVLGGRAKVEVRRIVTSEVRVSAEATGPMPSSASQSALCPLCRNESLLSPSVVVSAAQFDMCLSIHYSSLRREGPTPGGVMPLRY